VRDFNRQHIIAFETSTPVCSVALHRNDGAVFERSATGSGVHSEKLFLFTKEVLAESGITFPNIESILVNNGPGSYTGLRIGSSAAKGMIFGSDKKLISVQSLASVALGGFLKDKQNKRVHAVINARRTHLYHQLFDITNGILTALTEADIKPISEITEMCKDDEVIAGTGIERLDKQVLTRCVQVKNEDAIRASNMIELIKKKDNHSFFSEVHAARFEPLYQLEE